MKRRINPNTKVTYSLKEIRKMKADEYAKGQQEALDVVNMFPLLVLRDKFGFGKKRLERFTNEYLGVIHAYNEGYLNLTDVIKTIEKETGLDYSDFIGGAI